MFKYLLPIAVIVSTSLHAQKPYVTKELQPYVNAYITDLVVHGIYPSRLAKMDSIILVPVSRLICSDTLCEGCSVTKRISRKIMKRKVLIQAYSALDSVGKPSYYRYLVYHELGHALFDLDHDDEGLHIMNSCSDDSKYASKVWIKLHERYIREIKKILLKSNNY